MAEIVKSLFGFSPQDLQNVRRQEQLDFTNTLARSGRTPQEVAGLMIGANLGQALGGAGARLFGAKDPQIERATQLDSILQKTQAELIDPNNPEEMYTKLYKNLSDNGFSREAQAVLAKGQEEVLNFQFKQSQIAENNRQAQAAKAPKLSPLSQLVEEKRLADVAGDTVLSKLLESKIDLETTRADKAPPSAETESERVIFDKYVRDLGKERGALAFQEWKQANRKEIAKSGVAGVADTVDVARLDSSFRNMVEPYKTKLSAINNALNLAKQQAKNNPQAGVQLNTLLASLYQDGRVSNQDIENIRNAGSLPARIVNNFNRIITGVDTETSVDDKIKLLELLQQSAATSNNDAVDRFERAWGSSDAPKATIEAFTKGSRWKVNTKKPKTAAEYLGL